MPKNKKNFSNDGNFKQKAWVISVDMGYGHQRAASPLRCIAYKGQVISANNYQGIPKEDRKIWQESRKFYEFVSKFKKVPVVGKHVFDWYDTLQEIPSFYPKRDLSKANIQIQAMYNLIEKKNWGKHLVDYCAKKPLPMIHTFFTTAFMAEIFDYPGDIYCLATDTDISRSWAPLKPASSRINYFAPNYRVVERLKLYGIRESQIYLTGFPLPLENTGNLQLDVLKKDLLQRLVNLDPKRRYWKQYHQTIKHIFKVKDLPSKSNHKLTVMFAVGGAGAQRDIGAVILKSLKNNIIKNQIRLVLVAGIHNDVASFFKKAAISAGLRKRLDKGVQIIHAETKEKYFDKFNKALHTTDIIWTKPSELSFYCALGIPIVMSPPIGSQEKFNRTWLQTIAAAVDQEDPRYCNQWLFDWLDSGWFAEAALEGFLEAPQLGTYNIERVLQNNFTKAKEPTMIMQY